jgi:Alr-MurF fusion protein
MMKYTLKNIADIIKASKLKASDSTMEISQVLIDSRNISKKKNTIFFALVGKIHDGHKFIPELIKEGVSNFVVSDKKLATKDFPTANFIFVEDTLVALQAFAKYHRAQFHIPVLGITGSNGKTIVKEWLHQLMYEDVNIIRSPKSFNSQVGVPLSVLGLNKQHQLAIFEAGISESDEMAALKGMIEPEIGILTNIGTAHDENFFNHNQKAGEKLRLFTDVDTLIYCRDHKVVYQTLYQAGLLEKIKTFSWGETEEANLRITAIQKKQNKTKISAVLKGKELAIEIPFIDNASIENAMHAWSFLIHQAYSQSVIEKRMKLLNPVAMRLEMKEGINSCAIINDYYNSDLKSLEIALDFLNQQTQHPKKTVILSDILQSGKNAEDLYTEVAKMLMQKGVTRLIGIGKDISSQADLFDIEKHFFDTTSDFLANYNLGFIQNETILLKGARVYAFETISKELQQKNHETVLEINLSALVHNLNYFRNKLDKDTKIMAMLKAFSYGSGSYEIAHLLEYHKIDYIAVAYVDEGIELRKAGIKTPIMIMNPEAEGLAAAIKYKLEPEIYNFRILEQLIEAIPENESIKIHIKIDTGMHRLGFEENDIASLIKTVKKHPKIHIQSVFSHLVGSDDAKHDAFTKKQILLLEKIKEQFNKAFDKDIDSHILNSSGIIRFNEHQMDMVRLGIGLYGVSSEKETQKELMQVGTLKTIVSQIKEIEKGESIGYDRKGKASKKMRIATIPIGYADGFFRAFSNGIGHCFINNKRVPIVGNICMDMCMLDITDLQVKEGDEVIIFSDGEQINTLAKAIDTIPYELLTNISRRVKRVYFYD